MKVRGLHSELVWHIGPFSDTTAAERVAGEPPTSKIQRKVDFHMALKADQKVAFSLQATDEVGNPGEFEGTIVYSVDDESIVTLTDNGDGTGEVAATGTLGTAVLSAEATRTSDSKVFMGSVSVDVIAGDVEVIDIVLGTPEEATPDV